MKGACKEILAVGLTVTVLAGCVAPNTMLVNPSTGEMMNCSASGWGWAGAPLAQHTHDKCVESLESAGYLPMEDVEPGRISITSDPTGAKIYAGPDRDSLDYVGTTPHQAVHPNNSRMWVRECYQVRKEGYAASEVECRNEKWGDRSVKFELDEAE
jgi:hypothetical protein